MDGFAPRRVVKRAKQSLHDKFGWHIADHGHSHWEGAEFLSRCSICLRVMIKVPGQPWRVRPS